MKVGTVQVIHFRVGCVESGDLEISAFFPEKWEFSGGDTGKVWSGGVQRQELGKGRDRDSGLDFSGAKRICEAGISWMIHVVILVMYECIVRTQMIGICISRPVLTVIGRVNDR